MRYLLLIIVALLGTINSEAAPLRISTSPINVVITPSKYSGVAPLGIVFSTVGSTSTATNKPFQNIQTSWNFGDTNTTPTGTCGTAPAAGEGFWRCGAQPGVLSKNTAQGPVAAHVFETPGTYVVTATMYDGTNTATQSQTITVTDPTTVYSGTNTICFFNTTLGSGCPAGATSASPTSDFTAALTSCTTGKRCLFKRGDTFTATATGTISSAGPITIGAYGSGAAPIITGTSQVVFQLNNAAVNDIRIMDLRIVGPAVSNTSNCVSITDQISGLLWLRNQCIGMGTGLIVASGAGVKGGVGADSVFTNLAGASPSGGGIAYYGEWTLSAFVGNSIGPFVSTSEHNIRIQPGQQVTIGYNSISTPGTTGKSLITMRAAEHWPNVDAGSAEYDPFGRRTTDAQWLHVADNFLDGGGSSYQLFDFAPASNRQNNWIYDGLAERNWIQMGPFASITGASALIIGASRITVKNNLCDASGNVTGGPACFVISPNNTSGAPAPDSNEFINNTFYKADASAYVNNTNFTAIYLDATGGQNITNTVVKNNLTYGPLAFQPRTLWTVGAGVTGTTGASNTFGNSSDFNTGTNQMGSVDPRFTCPTGCASVGAFTPVNAKPTAGYAIGSGVSVPVWSDFFLTTEPSPRDAGAVNH